MKLLTILFWIFTVIKGAYSQDLVSRTDSLISKIESLGNFVSRNYCDTFFVSHSDCFHFDCIEYYSFENKFIRIVSKRGRFKIFNFYDSEPGKTGVTSFDTFYFYKDTLLKAVRTNYNTTVTISYFYFTGTDLAQMERRGLKLTDEYKRAEFCIGLGHELLKKF